MASSMHEDRPEGLSSAGLSWTKSSLSFSNSNCVEVASLPNGGVDVVCHNRGRYWQDSVADYQHVNLADPHRVARRNQLVGRRPPRM